MTQEPPRPSARDLVRKRSRTYRAPETGRHHHIGAAPELQPVLGEDGSSYVGTSDVQLAARTVAQLESYADRLRAGMAAAAGDLRFEDAAALRDDLSRVEAELARRG
jgi:excinuclease UvrABC helicase subunit UvrB